MPIDERLITKEILGNTLVKEIYPEIECIKNPKLGKVRVVYDIGNGFLLIMSSDDLSTHDVVHRRQVYGKGENLDAISAFYFDLTRRIIPNHYVETVAPNTWLVQRADPILVEMVFRNYLTGSGWNEYVKQNGPERGMNFCGAFLRPGYRKNEKLEQVVFTPTAKGKAGDFDIPEFEGLDPSEDDPKIDKEIILKNYKKFGLRRECDLDFVIDAAFRLYKHISSDLRKKGYLLADTKWEFGYLPDGKIILIDECVTPDSSRIWDASEYVFNPERKEFTIVQKDKQHFRDHIESLGLHKDKEALAEYWMPDNVLREGVIKYCDIREEITETLPVITEEPKKQMILDALSSGGYLR
ncbi:MAG: phosphoribosylaminoimidazolesuccinocarboxamide synthase [archaeon]